MPEARTTWSGQTLSVALVRFEVCFASIPLRFTDSFYAHSGLHTIRRICYNHALRTPLDEDRHAGNHGLSGGLTERVADLSTAG